MKKISKILLGLGLISVASTTVFAGSDTVDVGATAVGANECHFTGATDIAFGAYNPYSDTDHPGTGDISFKCTNNTDYTLALDKTSSTLQLNGNSTHVLNYNVALDSTSGVATNHNTIITTGLTASIDKLQDELVGDYSDTIIASITF